jgi:GTP-binding protein
LKIFAEFVTSAAAAAGLPRDGAPEVALVGRSNVGKSSLINALVRRRLTRTSAAPGKTRLANIYRVARGTGSPLYLVDLPGYGYARGGAPSAQAFDQLTRDFFGRVGDAGQGAPPGRGWDPRERPPHVSAILLVDARHPGLDSDRAAWQWIGIAVARAAIVATKIDKLARGLRIRALRECESVYDEPVLPVSAVTGEGLDELWKLIDRLANSSSPEPTARPRPRKN